MEDECRVGDPTVMLSVTPEGVLYHSPLACSGHFFERDRSATCKGIANGTVF